MRWIFIFLMVLNIALGVIYWVQSSNDKRHEQLNASALADVGDKMPGEPLILLGEVSPEQLEKDRAASVQATAPIGAGDQPQGDSAICAMVGPVADPAVSAQLLERMAALSIIAAIQDVDIPGNMDYWVMLPPEPSRKNALRKLQELQAKKIDSHIIPHGDMENGISLGVFSTADSANTRLAEIQGYGYQAQVTEKQRVLKEYWVVFDPVESSKLSDVLWTALSTDFKNIERRQGFCKSASKVASKNNIQ